MDIYRPGFSVIIVSPNLIQQTFPGQYYVRILRKNGQQVELFGAEFELFVIYYHLPFQNIDMDTVNIDGLRRLNFRLRTAQNSFHSGHQLGRIEWLGQIVIGA